MRGHTYKRGTSWTAVYDERPNADGKRKQRSKGGFATEKQANAFLVKQLDALNSGTYAALDKITLGEFLDHEWFPAVEDTLRPLSASRLRPVGSRTPCCTVRCMTRRTGGACRETL